MTSLAVWDMYERQGLDVLGDQAKNRCLYLSLLQVPVYLYQDLIRLYPRNTWRLILLEKENEIPIVALSQNLY